MELVQLFPEFSLVLMAQVRLDELLHLLVDLGLLDELSVDRIEWVPHFVRNCGVN